MAPLVTLTLLFVAGIVVTSYLKLGLPVWLGAAVLVFVFGLLSLSTRRRQRALLALLLLAFLTGGLRTSLALLPEQSLLPLVGSQVELEGILIREPQVTESGMSYVLAVRLAGTGESSRPVRGQVLIQDTRSGGARYQYGENLRVKGTLLRPRPAGNFGQFDYRAYLERRGIEYTLTVYADEAIHQVGKGAGNPYLARLLAWRRRLLTAADTLAPADAALLKGITLGERRGVPEETVDLFTASGTVHLLAVSGVHVGLVAALVLGIVRLLRAPLWLQALLATAAVGCYTVWTGFAASAVRSGVMFLLGLLGLATGRPKNSLVALSAAALLLLVMNPLLLFDAGFQLSFAAAGGILWLAPLFFAGSKRSRVAWLWAPLTVSLAAQLAVWPLSAYYFSGVSAVGFLASLLAVPVSGVALGLGLTGLLAGAVYLPLGKIFLGAAALALRLLTWIAELFARVPLAFVYLKQPPALFLGAYYLILAALPWALRRWAEWSRLRRGAALTAVLLVLVFTWRGPGLAARPLTVDFLAVGQGDAILIRSPSGQAALIDTGPRQLYGERLWDAGESVVLPYLRSQGVHRLEILFLTHGDADHTGGAPAVLAGVPVGAVIAPPGFAKDGPQLVLSHLKEKGLPLYEGSRGMKVDLGSGVELTLYGPPPVPLVTENQENDNSLVILLRYGKNSFLFMGDAGLPSEEALRSAGDLFAVDVLKVAHHGSSGATGQEFLAAVNPKLAVISVGKNNFGHPSPETLGRILASGASIVRTDQAGQVRVLADGERIQVYTRAGGKEVLP